MAFYTSIEDPNSDRSVVIEDDDRTGYAYLLDGESIISDVWLYNAIVVDNPSWKDRNDLPFPNKREFMSRDPQFRIDEKTVISCDWYAEGVLVYVDGVLTARLEAGAKPGWSRLVRIDGPLGRRLTHSELGDPERG